MYGTATARLRRAALHNTFKESLEQPWLCCIGFPCGKQIGRLSVYKAMGCMSVLCWISSPEAQEGSAFVLCKTFPVMCVFRRIYL